MEGGLEGVVLRTERMLVHRAGAPGGGQARGPGRGSVIRISQDQLGRSSQASGFHVEMSELWDCGPFNSQISLVRLLVPRQGADDRWL